MKAYKHFNKIKAIFFLTITILASCQSSSKSIGTNSCGVIGLTKKDLFPKIINGSQCAVDGSPVVLLTLLTDQGVSGICSGTLISNRAILTAAHCVSLPDEKVTLSGIDATVEGRVVEVSSYVAHPEYNFPQNDVAIVYLAKPVSVAPLPLLLSESLEGGDIINIYGYGLTEDNTSGTLRSGKMKVTGVTAQNIIAVFDEEDKGSNVCNGDSGGPAVGVTQNGVPGIVGLTSFGTAEGCLSGDQSNFTNVQGSKILDFIQSHVSRVGAV